MQTPCHEGSTPRIALDQVAITLASYALDALQDAQLKDPIVSQIYRALLQARNKPNTGAWRKSPLHRYGQLWSQLGIKKGIAYAPGPNSEVITVPVLPNSLKLQALHRNHDIPSAGHQGSDKTFQRLRQEAYWVSMAKDVLQYCLSCVECQRSKPPAPTRAPMTNLPIGRP